MNKVVLTDSGFWCALYDSNDQHFEQAKLIADLIDGSIILIPRPTMYEFMNTRFMRRTKRIEAFEEQLTSPDIVLLSDEPYRDKALTNVLSTRRCSLVDALIREILLDPNIRTDYLVTFNVADFQDVCWLKKVEILDR